MKVMLIVPVHKYREYPTPLSISDFPTGFAYLAASLKQAGHEVIGVNLNNITGYASGKLMVHSVLSEKIERYKPDLIGIGGLAVDYAFLVDCMASCRSLCETPIVLGGQIVTNDAEDIFNLLKPDYAIVGEAEGAMVRIANGGSNKGIISGVYRGNIDSLPFPDYEPFNVDDMLDNHSIDTRLLYRYSRPYPRPFVIVASRSCPFNCSFCVHKTREIPYRARSIPNIIAEIKVMYEKYNFNILMIDDELFAVNKKRLVEFSEAVIKGKEEYGWDFDWMFQTHASAKLDLETLKLAKKAGCYLFSYGLESASPVVLKSMNKKIKIEQVIEAMGLAHEAKVGFAANLIFGDIAETVHTWAESLGFWFTYGRDDFIFLANLMPYPGSKLFNSLGVTNKKLYYEHIDTGIINMTQIKPADFENLIKLVAELEGSWLFVTHATDTRVEVEETIGDNTMYRLWGTCPYCGEESMYRQPMTTKQGGKFSMGTGCTHCNRKIKLEVG